MIINSQSKIFTFPNSDYQLDIFSIYKGQLLWTEKNYKLATFPVCIILKIPIHPILLPFLPYKKEENTTWNKYLFFTVLLVKVFFFKDTYLLLIFRATFIFTVWPGSNLIAVQRQQKDYQLQITRGGIRFNTSPTQLTHNKSSRIE